MDPQACIDRIIEAMDEAARYDGSDQRDELHWAMLDLWHWLERGGFSPIVQDLGNHDYATDYDACLEIRREDNDPEMGFEMLRRSPTGGHIVKRYAFRVSA